MMDAEKCKNVVTVVACFGYCVRNFIGNKFLVFERGIKLQVPKTKRSS